jgi:hypothetical protein
LQQTASVQVPLPHWLAAPQTCPSPCLAAHWPAALQ